MRYQGRYNILVVHVIGGEVSDIAAGTTVWVKVKILSYRVVNVASMIYVILVGGSADKEPIMSHALRSHVGGLGKSDSV